MRDLQTHIDDEVLAEYAMGSLPFEEMVAVGDHLQHCRHCQQEVASLRATAALLPYGLTITKPPPELRDRVLRAATASQSGAGRVERGAVRQRPAGPGWLRRLAPALAALTFVAGLLLGRAWPAAGPGLQTPPEGQTVALAGQARGTVLVANNHSYVRVMVNGLPPLEAGKVYQLWLLGRGAPISAGIFAGSGDGSGMIEINGLAWSPDYTGIAITIEPAGGSMAPTSDIIARAGL